MRSASAAIGATVLLGLTAAAGAAGAAGTAGADGLELGPVRAYPSLAVRETRDDNIFLTSAGEESDWITSIAPALRLELPVRRFVLGAEAGAEIVRYQDFDAEDAENWNVGGSLGAEFPGGLSFSLSDRYRKRYLPATQEYGVGEESSLNLAEAKVGYQIRDALRAEVEASAAAYRFDESEDRRRDEQRLRGGLSWRVFPRTSVFGEVGHAVFDYVDRPAQDGTATHAALGLSWDVTARSVGSVKAGLQRKSYDAEDPGRGTEDTDTWIVTGTLRHLLTRRTALALEVARGTEESDFPQNPFYVQTAVGGAVTQRFTAKIYGKAGARYERNTYPNATSYDNPFDGADITESGKRTDTALRGELALGYDVLDWLNLELVWDGRRRSSTYDTFEFDVTRVSLAVTAAF